nr:hypothetical protein [Actinomycetota bacterium]
MSTTAGLIFDCCIRQQRQCCPVCRYPVCVSTLPPQANDLGSSLPAVRCQQGLSANQQAGYRADHCDGGRADTGRG